MKIKNLIILLSCALLMPGVLIGQGGLDPSSIVKPLSDSWPTYSGDYSGKRYSALTQINQTTVKNLTLAWVGRLSAGPGGGGGGTPTIIGGEGSADFAAGGVNIKGS